MVTTVHTEAGSKTAAQRAGVVTSVRLAEAGVTASRVRAGQIRSAEEIAAIGEAAFVARIALDAALKAALVGATPASLSAIVSGIIAAERAESVIALSTNEAGERFPASCCVGVNDQFLMAVPSDAPLCDGDVVTVDVAVRLRGWCADVAGCVVVGKGTSRKHAMVEACHEMIEVAKAEMAPGVRWSRVAAAMQQVAADRSLGLVTLHSGLSGHGIGRQMHEAPVAPCALDREFAEKCDFTLLPGMVLCVEPAITEHADGVRALDEDGYAIGVNLVLTGDSWSLRTESGRPGCAIERTIVVTKTGCEVLGEVCGEARATSPQSVQAAVTPGPQS